MKFRQTCICILAILTAFSSFSPLHASSKDKSGDFLEVAMPLSAFLISYLHDDYEGGKQFAFALTGSALTTLLLKNTIEKERPDGSGFDSFPSGHAAITFSSASYLGQRYGWQYGLPAYTLATWTAYTRVDGDFHEIEDVLAGAAIGFAFSYFLVEPNDSFFIAPIITKDQIGLITQVNF